MSRQLLTGNGAAAMAARLADVDYVPAFPITPQTEIIETLSTWIQSGEMPARMTMLDSEHSMITAAGTAAATGARVFTATSSQGLLYAMEMLYAVAGWRVPFVLANVSRGVAAPITLESDHTDIMSARDCGALQLHCATCQEVVDLSLIAFHMAEDARVRLPAIVNLDGFYLSFTREPVTLPSPEQVAAFLPPFTLQGTQHGRASSQAVAVLGGSPYSYFRYELHLAAQAAELAFTDAAAAYAEHCGRTYTPLYTRDAEDADVLFVMLGSFSTKAEAVVEQLRTRGRRVGLVRPRMLRPFPTEALRQALGGAKALVCIDQNLSMGSGGVLATEVRSALYGLPDAPHVLSFVGGLGGRDIRDAELVAMVDAADRAIVDGHPPPPRLLFSEDELREVHKLQAIAGAAAADAADAARRGE